MPRKRVNAQRRETAASLAMVKGEFWKKRTTMTKERMVKEGMKLGKRIVMGKRVRQRKERTAEGRVKGVEIS